MSYSIDRRIVLRAGAALAAASVLPVRAQAKKNIRFAAVFSDKDIRAEMMKMLANDVAGSFTIEPFLNGSLYK